MGGVELRIGRSFDRESERAFVTAFDGDPGTTTAVIEGCTVPVPTSGGSKGDPEKAVRDAAEAGARGASSVAKSGGPKARRRRAFLWARPCTARP